MELPVDILPEILFFLAKPAHLASACLVNKLFYRFAVRQLYDRIAIHSWHKDGKKRAIALVTTLACCPELARLVHHLEIRDFPREFHHPRVLNALQLCTNLRSCIWTRDATLTSDILQTLASCPELRELEINGHSNGNYDHTMLLRFRNLTKFSIIMPSASVVSQLHNCLALNAHSLRSLTLICRATPLVTDTLLESIAPILSNLDHFYIAGCPKLENRGVWALLSTNKRGLLSLGLEGLSTHFDIQALSLLSASHTPHPLRRLHSITLSIPFSGAYGTASSTMALRETFTNLLASSSLERFQIYSTSLWGDPISEGRLQTELLLRHIAETHANTLRRFSVHRILMSFDTIQIICNLCHRLEELFVVLRLLPSSMGRLATALSPSKSLRTVHVNNPRLTLPSAPHSSSDTGGGYCILLPCILLMLEQCSSTITQFGWNSMVWEVKRTVQCEEGVQRVQLSLVKYENPLDVPEQFLVVRT